LYIICQATPDHNVLQILPPFLPLFSGLLPHSPRKDFPTTPHSVTFLLCCIIYPRRGVTKPVPNQGWAVLDFYQTPTTVLATRTTDSSSGYQCFFSFFSFFFISKFWRNLTKKLVKISRSCTRIRKTSNLFPNFLCRKLAKFRQKKTYCEWLLVRTSFGPVLVNPNWNLQLTNFQLTSG
jgi:hypothetical protein